MIKSGVNAGNDVMEESVILVRGIRIGSDDVITRDARGVCAVGPQWGAQNSVIGAIIEERTRDAQVVVILPNNPGARNAVGEFLNRAGGWLTTRAAG